MQMLLECMKIRTGCYWKTMHSFWWQALKSDIIEKKRKLSILDFQNTCLIRTDIISSWIFKSIYERKQDLNSRQEYGTKHLGVSISLYRKLFLLK